MKTYLVILFSLLSCSHLFAQSNEEKEVEKAMSVLRQAMIDADKNTLEKVVSEDLSYGHSGGSLENKSHFIETFVTGESDFVTMDLSEQTIKVTGKTAIVRHKLEAETSNRGVKGNVKLKVLLVFIKQKGKWILLARQAVKLT